MFTAYDVARPRKSINRDGESMSPYPFGHGPQQFAAELRKLADAVEADRVILQKVSVSTVGRHDDFPYTFVHFALFEKQTPK